MEIPASVVCQDCAQKHLRNCLFSVQLTNEELFSSVAANLDVLKFL